MSGGGAAVAEDLSLPKSAEEDFDGLSAAANPRKAAATKRRKITATKRRKNASAAMDSERAKAEKLEEAEEVYMAAVRGSTSSLFHLQYSSSPVSATFSSLTGEIVLSKTGSCCFSGLGGGGRGADLCFRCGRLGHWARDCDANSKGINSSVSEGAKPCAN